MLKSLWKGIFGYPGWRPSYVFVNAIKESIILVFHVRGLIQARRYRNAEGLKLHLGCGTKIKKSWVNIDINPYADVSVDFRRRFPFPDKSCSIVYSEHVLEHFAYPDEVDLVLKECHRLLSDDGIISIGVPDTESPLIAYAEGENAPYFQLAKDIWHPQWCQTRMEHINYHFRQGDEHKFAYDFETLKRVLEKAGFRNVERRKFDPDLDGEDRELGTLYVDGRKN